jgi:hypothetical protein
VPSNKPRRPAKQIERELRIYRPLRSLCLLEVLRDCASWPVLGWALSTLLLGPVIYHWLEGWSYLGALVSASSAWPPLAMATSPHDIAVPRLHQQLRHQRYRHSAGAV